MTQPGKGRKGTRTSAFGVGKREGHDSSAFYERFHAPVVSDDDTINAPSFVDDIVVGDARDMSRVADSSVALVVTSPPYFAGKAYEEAMGHGHIPANYVEYLQMLRDVFAECVRVLQPGGRIAVNVANLGRRPYRSLAADVTTILQDDLRLLLRGEVVWVKQRGAAGNCAWGSFQRPANPVLRDLTERVIIASKGRFDRAVDVKQRAAGGLPSVSTMSRDEFMEITVDVWEIPPESAARVGHPAPFPVALPERLIHMNTYEGEVVLDPFMGSGTTAVAAVRTGRHFIGYDTDKGYRDAAMQRVAGEGRQPQVQLPARARRDGDPVVSGWSSKELAKAVLAEAGYTAIEDSAVVLPGVQPTLSAVDAKGRRWWFEVVGGRTSNRPGAQRVELLWRAIAKGAVVHATDPAARFGVLTVGMPTAVAGGKALAAVTGPKRAVALVADLLADDAVARLRRGT
ncbi:MAG: site-specific DNA-methyltransferase [Ilumatobacter sp.]|nr:site-specific DNA-methyltransferase [Ilumatobacter sp.]